MKSIAKAVALLCGATVLEAQETPPTRAGGGYMNIGFTALTVGGWSSSRDLRAILQGDHDPKVRGFSIPNTEVTLDGAVDPYFKGVANIALKLDENGETGVELEEAYVLTTSLPGGLQVKAGQFFAEFGRQNTTHPHAWSFVEQPVVLSRMFGPEGLRSQGVRLSWLLPAVWYAEAMVGVFNSANGTAFSFRSDESADVHGGVPFVREVLGFDDMLIVPRVAASFDPTPTQTVLFGASAALGPNTGGAATRTTVLGADAYWKWKSARAQQGFPFVSIQFEGLTRRYEADARLSVDDTTATLAAADFKDRGGYVQALWGIKPRIVAGLRAESASGDATDFTTPFRGDRTRISPSLTWYPTEFSKLRFQYNYDDRPAVATNHSIWVQFEFLLGAHAAHKF